MENRKKSRQVFYRLWVCVILLLVFGIFSIFSSVFSSGQNIMNILHQAVPLMIIATGLSFVLLNGNIDISVGSIMYISTAVGIIAINDNAAWWQWVLIIIGIGALAGFINGFLVSYLGIHSMIVTLAAMTAYRGIALHLTHTLAYALPENYAGWVAFVLVMCMWMSLSHFHYCCLCIL
jgi:ribose/xylose/arabinose/galactoside ABC-type transport system permease subunit